MTYREQEVRELPAKPLELACYCDAPAEVNCDSCRRPRCAAHVSAGLCSRCSVVINRELAASSGSRWFWGGSTGVAVAATALGLKLAALSLLGLPAAIGSAFLLRHLRRRQLAKTFRAPLALSSGEVTAPVEHKETFPSAPPPPPGVAGF